MKEPEAYEKEPCFQRESQSSGRRRTRMKFEVCCTTCEADEDALQARRVSWGRAVDVH